MKFTFSKFMINVILLTLHKYINLWYIHGLWDFISSINMFKHLVLWKEEKLWYFYICMISINLLLYGLTNGHVFVYWILVTYVLMIISWDFIISPWIWHEMLKWVHKLWVFIIINISKMGSVTRANGILKQCKCTLS